MNSSICKWARNFKRARRVAILDRYLYSTTQRQFQRGTRPVIRWIKGDGLDDEVTRAAICQATRLFGDEVDYCLVTQGVGPERVREILSWAEQSVEWWPITDNDNSELAKVLNEAGCPKEDFGFWWKWFPERVRVNAPEWILDGDMVITGRPEWFDHWKEGKDPIRVSGNSEEVLYGEYSALVDSKSKLYSGLISLPPKITYMKQVLDLLKIQPLKKNHDGRFNPSEQGVIVSVFQKMNAVPIPLYEFPFAQSNFAGLNYGLSKARDQVWGYHFARSFVMKNPHFEKLCSEGVIYSKSNVDAISKYHWLSGGAGQWGVPSWGMNLDSLKVLISRVNSLSPGKALELGTSRGRLAAILEEIGFKVKTVDHIDRGATINLKGLDVEVVIGDAIDFLANTKESFDLIVIDIHGNSIETWKKIWSHLPSKLLDGGKIILNNFNLFKIDEWSNEKGVARLVESLNDDWIATVLTSTPPGIVMLERRPR